MKLDCFFKKTDSFTVGELRTLFCKGDSIPQINSPLTIQFQRESQKYSLHVISLESSSKNEIALQVTSYKTGQYDNQSFKLVSDSKTLEVNPLSWEVSSVLKSSASSELKPYPPYGPWGPSYPLWYKASWMTLLIILIGVMIQLTLKRVRQKKIKKRISERLQEKTPLKYFIDQLSSFFTRGLKNKENESQFFTQLNLMLREFLENQFEIPVEWNFKKIKKQKPVLKDRKILEILFELEEGMSNKNSYSEKDKEQLLDMTREWVFQFDKKTPS